MFFGNCGNLLRSIIAGSVFFRFTAIAPDLSKLIALFIKIMEEVKDNSRAQPLYQRVALYRLSVNRASVISKLALTEILSPDNFEQFASVKTKDPLFSIHEQLHRLQARDPHFARLLDWIREPIGEFAVTQIVEGVGEKPLEIELVDRFVVSLISGHKELVNKTIQANLIYVIASLMQHCADLSAEDLRTQDFPYRFGDGKKNPIGQMVSLLTYQVQQSIPRLEELEKIPDETKRITARKEIFQTLFLNLLKSLFPGGAQEVQLFHPYVPFLASLKRGLWYCLCTTLPPNLEQLYEELSSFELEHPHWKKEVNQFLKGITTTEELLERSPGAFKNLALRFFPEELQKSDKQKLHPKQLLQEYVREFIETEDRSLKITQNFLIRYLLQHFLTHLSKHRQENDAPATSLSMLEKSSNSKLFALFSNALRGNRKDKTTANQAVLEMRQLIGLDREETLPLPSMMKPKVWPYLNRYLQKKAPAVLLGAIPTFRPLSRKKVLQQKLLVCFGDSFQTQELLFFLSDQLSTLILEKLRETAFISQEEGTSALFNVKMEQEASINDQWKQLLDREVFYHPLVHLVQESFYSIFLQMVTDIHRTYSQESAHLQAEDRAYASLAWIFAHEDREIPTGTEQRPPFSSWLMQKIAQEGLHFDVSSWTSEEKKAWRVAIELANRISEMKERAVKAKEVGIALPAEEELSLALAQKEFEKSWKIIQIKSERLTRDFLALFRYQNATDLPLPKGMQVMVWDLLLSSLPPLLFHHFSDFLMLRLEEAELRGKINGLKEGPRMIEGCQALSEDFANNLSGLLKEEDLRELIEEYTPHSLKKKLKAQTKKEMALFFSRFLSQEASLKKMIQNYSELFFLKIICGLATVEDEVWDRLYALAKKTQLQLLQLPFLVEEGEFTAQKEIIDQFIGEVLLEFGIKDAYDLSGMPIVLRKALLGSLKSFVAKYMLAFYRLDQHVRRYSIAKHEFETILPSSKVKSALFSLSRFALHQIADQMAQEVEGQGQLKGVTLISGLVEESMSEAWALDWRIASFVKKAFSEAVFDAKLTKFFSFLNENALAHELKHDVSVWLSPVIADRAQRHLVHLLKKEEASKELFDQKLLMALVPVFRNHFADLKTVSQKEALSRAALHQAAQKSGRLHPALHANVQSEEQRTLSKQVYFYEKQADLIFKLVFPEGIEDMRRLFSFAPDMECTPEKYEKLKARLVTLIAKQLPIVLETLFDQSTLSALVQSILTKAKETLKKPIVIDSAISSAGTIDEAIGEEVGALALDIAAFFGIPDALLAKMPKETLGTAILANFDGNLLASALPQTLQALEEKKHLTKSERDQNAVKEKEEKEALPKELAETLMGYLGRYAFAQMEHCTDIFKHPIARFLRSMTLTLISFVLFHVIGNFFRLTGLERLMIFTLEGMIKRAVKKIEQVFSDPTLHENFAFKAVESLEKELQHAPTEKI